MDIFEQILPNSLYYLNVMAGPKRAWKFHNDPDHEWLMNV
jgi:5-deoxy-glucuronate isomerase